MHEIAHFIMMLTKKNGSCGSSMLKLKLQEHGIEKKSNQGHQVHLISDTGNASQPGDPSTEGLADF